MGSGKENSGDSSVHINISWEKLTNTSTFHDSMLYVRSLTHLVSLKRAPAWTDRIMYTTYSDSPETPTHSAVTNALYTSIPSYTTSDHVRAPHLRNRRKLMFVPSFRNLLSQSSSFLRHRQHPRSLHLSFVSRPTMYLVLTR